MFLGIRTSSICSLALLLADVAILTAAICWRVKTESDGSQIALFFNNEIGQRKETDSEKYA